MAVTYCADTCILSTLSKRIPDPAIKGWIGSVENLVVPMGALIEFEQGIYMKRETGPARFRELLSWREELLNSGIQLVDTDMRVALKYGEMRACRKLKHLWNAVPNLEVQRGGQDIHIAACAITNGFVVATDNISDFMLIHKHFSLPGLYNPKTDTWHVMPEGAVDEAALAIDITSKS